MTERLAWVRRWTSILSRTRSWDAREAKLETERFSYEMRRSAACTNRYQEAMGATSAYNEHAVVDRAARVHQLQTPCVQRTCHEPSPPSGALLKIHAPQTRPLRNHAQTTACDAVSGSGYLEKKHTVRQSHMPDPH